MRQLGKHKLYYRGEWDDHLFDKCMTIVGSRRMTDYGKRVIEKIMPKLVQDGWTIVSGFMYGVDQYAHKTCIENGGRTIAVLGWGINYPMSNIECLMSNEIIEKGGLLLSLWEDQPGTLWTFPARDQVMADIGHELIVIEAAAKSGSLITAEMAYKLGKPIWAIPGPITSSVSVGTNQLIADGKAKMLTSNLKFEILNLKSNSNNPILKLIQDEGLDTSEISRRLDRPASEIGAELTMLMLQGSIIERDGKYYVD